MSPPPPHAPQIGEITFTATLELGGKTTTEEVPLADNPAAHDFFDRLSYSNEQRFVLSSEGAKTDETRRRRIAKTVAQLSEGLG